jgi:hypothetical protein
MDFDKEIAVGIKFLTGPVDIKDMKSSAFIGNMGFKFKLPEDIDPEKVQDNSGLFTGDNKMTCKYFDDKEGIMYVHFDYEVLSSDLYMFEDEEIIYKKVVE